MFLASEKINEFLTLVNLKILHFYRYDYKYFFDYK